jgi:putative membrane protein
MARLFGLLLLIVLAVFGLSFAVLNAEPVSLNYYFGYRDIPLSMIVVLSLALGAVIGILFSMGMILRLKQQVGGLRRLLQLAEKRADELHILPAKE